MDNDRLITLAIHTFDKAAQLKALLELEGVEATLQNVNLSSPVLSAGVRVRIKEGDLPLALRIIENPEIFGPGVAVASNSAAERQSILVPVDFSEKSVAAARLALTVAASGAASRVVLLNSFLVPHTNPLMNLGSSQTVDSAASDADEVRVSVVMAKAAGEEMHKLERLLRAEIKRGNLPAVSFSTVVVQGLPEEAIGQYLKDHREVRLLLMGTRSVIKKSHDLAGSITAEVLNSCRVQALTLPEDSTMTGLNEVKSIAMLSHLEQEDFLMLDAVSRLLPADAAAQIRVICMPNDRYSKSTNDAARRALTEYCNEHFPNYSFTIVQHNRSSRRLEIDGADLVVLPSRKKNILARLFNPGAAHRLLFQADVPLLVVPV
ncbi:MAG: universal stress protein [Bacteroides sp.]|nr:universal stress protein [Bacteroidales bacterium]MBD5326083.1 universal stress protein [Bacteroides sp.]MBD5424644.1 universal stress protein [Bacteroides sp.]MDE6223290.1 universal stress protein [Muribaculaceae bacterium]